MKKIPAHLRFSKLSSFTLVELLVVMGIIAILAAVLLPAASSAIKAAKRAKAGSTASQIQTATLAYYTEYSVYPVPTGASTTGYTITDVLASQSAWGNLICILCGNIEPYSPGTTFTATTITNSRGIAFLSLKASDVDSGNAPLNPLPTGTGANAEIYFNIAIDSGYSGIIGATPSTVTMPNFATGTTTSLSPTGGTSTAGVAVWANCVGATTFTNANWWVHTY